jgi:hypothetical protein
VRCLPESAQNAIVKILEATGIRRVIALDDSYGRVESDGFEEALALANSLTAEQRGVAFESVPRLHVDVRAVFEERFREYWQGLEEGFAGALLQTLRKLANVSDTATLDADSQRLVTELFGSHGLTTFSSEQDWLNEEGSILDTSKTEKTLILFDEDLSGSGEGREGLELVKRILSITTADHQICCGLLSHKYQPETVTAEWDVLCLKEGLDRSRFVLIPKRFVRDPNAFATLIKITAISRDCTELKNRTKELLEAALNAASSELEKINVYDLEEIVFRAAYEEGVWEPETLLRLFGLFHRIETRKRAIADSELQRLAAVVRKLSIVVDNDSENLPSHHIWELERLEKYDAADYLNVLHRPIDLGDIFEIGTGKKKRKYILIAPQCDLMVRSKVGTRGNDADTTKEVVLARLTQHKNKRLNASWELDHYQRNTEWFVDFKATKVIQLWVLDLCVFNADGSATFATGNAPPKYLIPAWEERYKFLSKKIATLVESYRSLKPNEAQAEKVAQLLLRPTNDESFGSGSLDMTAGKISFPIVRVERLLTPRSTNMVSAYTQFLTREAYEHPFEIRSGREVGRAPDAELIDLSEDEAHAKSAVGVWGRIRQKFGF